MSDSRREEALRAMAQAGGRMIAFTVLGTPAPAGSKTAFVNKATGRAHVTDASKRSKPWKAVLALRAEEIMAGRDPLGGALYLRLSFAVKRPVKHYTKAGALGAEGLRRPWPSVRPDAIKLARAVEDALSGIVWQDDAQIVLEAVSKHYAPHEGVHIEVLELSSLERQEPSGAPAGDGQV